MIIRVKGTNFNQPLPKASKLCKDVDDLLPKFPTRREFMLAGNVGMVSLKLR